jgi:3-dehydroquinate synthase
LRPEAELGYQELLHGEAVAHGMLYAVRLARARGLDPTVASRIEQLVGRLGPPPLPALDAGALLARMARDKKARESGLAWVLPEAVGRGGVHCSVSPELVRGELAGFLGLG